MTKLLTIFSLFFLCICAGAQSTVVSGTLVDPQGNTWSSATVTAVFTQAPNVPGPYIWDGGTFNAIPASVTSDSGGNFSITLPTNVSHINPSGSTWLFSICPNASLQCAVVNVALSGSTFNILPTINGANAWPVGPVVPTSVAKVYNTNQTATPPQAQGGLVYNTTNQTMNIYTITGWQPFATVGGLPVVTNPIGTQTITQPLNSNFNIQTSGTGALQHNGVPVLDNSTGVQYNPTSNQTITNPSATTLKVTVAGVATGMTANTPLLSTVLVDNSALSTDGSMQGDTHLTPYYRADIQANGPNDLAAYYNFNCNYTGGGPTGNCIPAFFIVGNTAADKHTGIWGGNTIVAEHANTPSFGWEVNTFNFNSDGHILPNGTYSSGPFFGYAATATSGTGFFTQQAAFLASNNSVGGSGGGWDYGLYVTNANQAAVLCGQPSNGAATKYCFESSSTGLATSVNNFPSVPSIEFISTWTGTISGIHSVTSQVVPDAGTNPGFCKNLTFDTFLGFQMCSDGGFISNGPSFIHSSSGAQTLTIGQTYSDTVNPAQLILTGGGSPSIQGITQGVGFNKLSLNPSGGGIGIGGGVTITSSSAVPQTGTPTVGKAACIKAAGPPVLIGFCSTVIDASGGCTCN